MRQVYAYALSDRFTVRVVEKVANARAVLPEGPDLILVDAGLEEADPYEVAASLKKPLKHAKAVVVTSRFHPWDEKRAAKAGIEHHIDKPFESDTLRARLDVLMGREPVDPPAAAAPIMRAQPKSRTPRPAQVAAAPPPLPATMPVQVPVTKAPAVAASPVKTVVAAPAPKAAPKAEPAYDLHFSGGWGEEPAPEEPAPEEPAAEAAADPNDPWGGGWGDATDGGAAEAAPAADPNDPWGGGWGEAPAAEEATEAAAEGSEWAWGTDEGTEAVAEGEGETTAWATEEAPAEDTAAESAPEGEGWGGDFDASGFAAELTAEGELPGEVEAEAAPAEESEVGEEYTETEGELPGEVEAAPEGEGWGGDFDASGFAAELTAEGGESVEAEAVPADDAETLAEYTEGEGAEAAAEPGEDGAEYTDAAIEAPADDEGAPQGEGWGGDFDASGYASELTVESVDSEVDDASVPAAPGSGSELRTLAMELDKLGLSAAQASSVLQLTTQAVERAVWDVVPRLAERIIREELDRLTKPS